MIFSTLSPAAAAVNAAAAAVLEPGKYYRFNPPVVATAIPTGGPGVCDAQDAQFERGWYLGFINNRHTFQGKPVNDRRRIATPAGHDASVVKQLRESYFHVDFVGGSAAAVDEDQSHR